MKVGFFEMASAFVSVILLLIDQIAFARTCSRAYLPPSRDPTKAPATPHILFILVDDLGYGDVGYHGSEIQTPVIDRLAQNGVKLENYYVQPLCTPTRSQLLSGRYQIHTGLQHGKFSNTQPTGLPLDSPTLADKLREAGYSTHLTGKWHLGFYRNAYLPTSRGFDSFYGILGGSCDHYSHVKCTDFTNICGYDFHDHKGDNFTVARQAAGRYSTSLITKRAVDIIYAHDPEKPLFLLVSYQAVHSPLQVPDKYEAMYWNISNWKRRLYAGMTSAMDDAVGRIVSAFRNTGLWRDTVLIFSTDNGGSPGIGSNLPLTGGKGSLWEGSIKGVGFVTSRFLQNRGTTHRGLLHVSDWFPTLVNLANGTLNGTAALDGYDVWNSISTGGRSPRKEILHNINPLGPLTGRRVWKDTFDSRIKSSIRIGPWKLITGYPGYRGPSAIVSYPEDQNVWLFNVARDPMEKRDYSRRYPGKVRHMLERLAAHHLTSVPVFYPPADPHSDPVFNDGAWGPWM
ncbi:arylsulfatase J-like [Liolophura sinensis]|uniref:arylsulfatase J-like n=1 Tax=Liolophura sinensis TaxID=3198878 RepID=UPI0031584719